MERIDTLLTTGMKAMVVMLSLGGFLWLAQYSLQEHGYTEDERASMERLHDAVTANDYLTQLAEVHGL